MFSQLIHANKEIASNNSRKYLIKQLQSHKETLSKTKLQLDDLYLDKDFVKKWDNYNPFKSERRIVAKLGNTINVSNAWLKCYEMLMHFNIIPEDIGETDTFLHFDNAAFPGSFILATHHFIKTQRPWHDKFEWNASSLIEAIQANFKPLADKYDLYKNYPNNWLMNEHNRGNVLVLANQLDFAKQLGGKVQLYTSDLGFDVSDDYNAQEVKHFPANVGQILTGLFTLQKGGSLITKQYSIFEATTISVIYATATFFDEFYICKPHTSKAANSEIYLVGKGFKGTVYLKHPVIVRLIDYIENESSRGVPIYDAKDYPPEFMKAIIEVSNTLTNNQVGQINNIIDSIKRNDYLSYEKKINVEVEQWYEKYQILPMTSHKKLNMKSEY